MKQATTNEFIIVDNPAEPIGLDEMLERNHTANKPAIAYKALGFVNRVMEQGNPLAIAENLAAIQYFIKEIEADDRLEDYVLEELNKTQGKVTLPSGTKIEKTETNVKFVYDKCGDPVLNGLTALLTQIQLKIEKRKAFLKTVPKEGLDIMVEGGELVKIFPPSKSSDSTYRVTLNPKDPNPQPLSDDLPF